MNKIITSFYKDKNYCQVEKKIGVHFKNQELLVQSFVHRSYFYEVDNPFPETNERLEFLGDAVLELVVTDELYNQYQKEEGLLTKWRAALVNTISLSKVASKLELEKFLLLSTGEKQNEKGRKSILADLIEALIGAIYLDQGLPEARVFIKKNILKKLPQIIEKKSFQDPKSTYQELAQEEYNITPTYKILKEEGPDHAKLFEVGVYLKNKLISKGRGASKQKAEQKAASQALKK